MGARLSYKSQCWLVAFKIYIIVILMDPHILGIWASPRQAKVIKI